MKGLLVSKLAKKLFSSPASWAPVVVTAFIVGEVLYPLS